MKILCASDSFKGSLTSEKTAELLSRAAREVFGTCECDGVPVADGGEGTVEAVVKARDGHMIGAVVHGPLMEQIDASFGALSEREAVLEMASASGLPLVPEEQRNPLLTTTYGTGELVRAALDAGYTDLSIAIGGSATNDGGMGFATALGARFYDKDGNELLGRGEDLARVVRMDLSQMDPRLKTADIVVMCDVTNPLTGPDGATYTFAAQKGATPEVQAELENGMQNYRRILMETFGEDPNDIPGSGAAGGLGAALRFFCNAEMKSGINTVLDLIGFDQRLEGVDLVVTGEGRTDWQSAFGKVLQGVGERCAAKGVPAVALCGSLGKDYEKIYECGIQSLMTTVDGPMPLSEALERAEELYFRGAVRLFRMVAAGRDL